MTADAAVRRVAEHLRDPEVEEFTVRAASARQLGDGAFSGEVAVDDADAVGGVEGVGHLARRRPRRRRSQRTALRHRVGGAPVE